MPSLFFPLISQIHAPSHPEMSVPPPFLLAAPVPRWIGRSERSRAENARLRSERPLESSHHCMPAGHCSRRALCDHHRWMAQQTPTFARLCASVDGRMNPRAPLANQQRESARQHSLQLPSSVDITRHPRSPMAAPATQAVLLGLDDAVLHVHHQDL